MLYITRRPGEKVILSDNGSGEMIATIAVEEFLGSDNVKLGIHAPRTVKIDRDYKHGNNNEQQAK